MYSRLRESASFAVDRTLKRIGVYLVRIADYDTVVGSQFSVPIEECLNGYAYGFGTKGSNPQVAFLREYISNPGITYEESSIRVFMAQFRPRNLEEALFGKSLNTTCRTSLLKLYVPFVDITRPFLPMPWSTPSEIARYRRGLAVVDRSRVAPAKARELNPHNVEQESKKEYHRLIGTYESIKEIGYKPSVASDGLLDSRFIQVVVLRYNEEERYVVMSGHHRVAALSVLGWTHIPVILVANGLPIVDFANVENWPVVREGVYDVSAARRVYEQFFKRESLERSAATRVDT